ncbi:hypothetical protein LCGC14_1350610 [marine sediment metagenome]|uniref:HTH luxR-type domain-containing protein n=1 Tax=marine sediment metagenome TaxID=412755 RepID=A0A0F9NDB7_9ZZZZ
MTEQGRFNPLDPVGILGAVRRDVDRLATGLGLPAPPGIGNPGNPGEVQVELEDALHLYLLSQQRPQESMSQTIARLSTGERLVGENLLTSAQHQVLALAAEGLSTEEIGLRLYIEPGTVRVHMKDIRRILEVPTTEEAVAAFGKPTLREREPGWWRRGAEERMARALRDAEERMTRALRESARARRARALATSPRRGELTPSQRQVLALAVEGLSNREIANKLGIHPATVGQHFSQSYQTIGLPTDVRGARREQAVAAFASAMATGAETPPTRAELEFVGWGGRRLKRPDVMGEPGLTEKEKAGVISEFQEIMGREPTRLEIDELFEEQRKL